MYITNLLSLSAALLGTLAAAAPTTATRPRAAEVDSMATAENWTLKSLSRTCAEDGSTCTWKFGVLREEEGAEETPCEHTLEALPDGTPATQIPGSGPSTCGRYTVTSGWSDGGGPGLEFTTLSVVDYEEEVLVWAGYKDNLVEDGQVVDPDKSWPVSGLP